VIYEEGTPVSCGTLDLANKMIKSVFTSPEKTGQGLAGFIINALKDKAKLDGIAKLSLASSPNAIDFYKKYSFRLIGDKKIWSEQAKEWIPCVEMHCDL
jgi:GNAT superfamily N-acetyltransferase